MLRIFRVWIDRYFVNEETVLFVVLLISSFAVVLTMGQILAPVIASLVFAYLLQGVVVQLKARKVPHLLAVVATFCVFVGGITAVVVSFLPTLWNQLTLFFKELPGMLGEGQKILLLLPQQYPQFISESMIQNWMQLVEAEVGNMGQSVVSFSASTLPSLVAVLIYLILVPILVFFFLKDKRELLHWMASFLPEDRPMMESIWDEMNDQIGNYARGKAIEILIVGAVTYVTFAILGVNYVALLAVLVGFSVVVPYIGAAVVTIPIAVIGYFQWGWETPFFYLMLAYGVIQALDGNVLVPLLFSEAVNLHPVAIILAVLVFGGFWGLWGVFFAIPLATLIKAILSAWPHHELDEEEGVIE